MCFTLQRYKFSSKSQHDTGEVLTPEGCVLPCKGTNFQANHNPSYAPHICRGDVFYLAKVQIFKQITTVWRWRVSRCSMCFTLQRYKFSSKSQLVKSMPQEPCDVFYLAKVQIFKQITTADCSICQLSVMCFTLQRYKFSSKSQLI